MCCNTSSMIANELKHKKHKIITANKLVITQSITVKCSRQYKSWFMTCVT